MEGGDADDSETMCVAIVDVLVSETDIDSADFTLYDTIDTEAVELLFHHKKPQSGNIRLAFDVLDERVVIERENGSVSVSLAE